MTMQKMEKTLRQGKTITNVKGGLRGKNSVMNSKVHPYLNPISIKFKLCVI
jgi:hypothetical protein